MTDDRIAHAQLAVMVDLFAPLRTTPAALSVEDPGHQSPFL